MSLQEPLLIPKVTTGFCFFKYTLRQAVAVKKLNSSSFTTKESLSLLDRFCFISAKH